MISILLVSHGGMAAGMKDSLELIVGPLRNVDVESLVAGQDIEEFKENVINRIKELNEGGGVLVFVDLFGASPYNVAQYATLKLNGAIDIRVITGMNLPMVLEGVLLRETSDLDSLVKTLLVNGRESIVEPITLDDINEDEGDY